MNTKQKENNMKPRFPTVQEQINYWNTKERLEHERIMSLDNRAESRDATNETRRAYIEGDGTKMQLYVRSMGKLLAVTALFNSDDNANSYCEKHRDEGVVATTGNLVFLANLYDHGTRAELPMSTDRTKVYLALPQIPDGNAPTTAKTLTPEEEYERNVATCEIYDERERKWSPWDDGRNPDGTGESYAERQV